MIFLSLDDRNSVERSYRHIRSRDYRPSSLADREERIFCEGKRKKGKRKGRQKRKKGEKETTEEAAQHLIVVLISVLAIIGCNRLA